MTQPLLPMFFYRAIAEKPGESVTSMYGPPSAGMHSLLTAIKRGPEVESIPQTLQRSVANETELHRLMRGIEL